MSGREMDCRCENNPQDAVEGWWFSSSNILMGAFSVVGYLLYRFSQTLPRLLRWQIRLFCYLTGLSTLWAWVHRLVGAVRGIRRFYKTMSRIWRFIAGESADRTAKKPGLRLILLGPSGGGRTSLRETLSGSSERSDSAAPVKLCTKMSSLLDGQEIAIIDTPDLLGSTLEAAARAREALRSLQLTSPGPHAFLLVMRAPGPGVGLDQDPRRAVRAAVELFGDGVTRHTIPVLTHADEHTPLDQLLEADSGDLKRALSLCGQRAELVELPPDDPGALCRHFVERVMEMEKLQGHFVHELQKREENLRQKLLEDMSSELAQKLGPGCE